MKEKISLEASGMPGVIKTMEKHFGKVIEKASRITELQSGITLPTSVIVGAPDKGKERKPCKTCGLETGYMWAERPEGAVIWCVNTRCVDFHTVFTPEEWEVR